MRTAASFTTSTLWMTLRYRCASDAGEPGPMARSMLKRTASALNGLPSWNFTPFRRWNVHVISSLASSQRSARSGTISPFASTKTSPLNRWRTMAIPSMPCVCCGSSVVTSVPCATVSSSFAAWDGPGMTIMRRSMNAGSTRTTRFIGSASRERRMVLAFEPAAHDRLAAFQHAPAARVDFGDPEVWVEQHEIRVGAGPDASLAVVETQESRDVQRDRQDRLLQRELLVTHEVAHFLVERADLPQLDALDRAVGGEERMHAVAVRAHRDPLERDAVRARPHVRREALRLERTDLRQQRDRRPRRPVGAGDADNGGDAPAREVRQHHLGPARDEAAATPAARHVHVLIDEAGHHAQAGHVADRDAIEVRERSEVAAGASDALAHDQHVAVARRFRRVELPAPQQRHLHGRSPSLSMGLLPAGLSTARTGR